MKLQIYPNKNCFPDATDADTDVTLVYQAADTSDRFFITGGAYKLFAPSTSPQPQMPIIGSNRAAPKYETTVKVAT